MRNYIKNNLLELCSSVLEMHNIILNEHNAENRVEYLLLCQQSVVAIGNTAAQHSSDINLIDKALETYCNNLLPLAQKQDITNDDLKKQDILINSVINIISNQDITYEVVFFPYSSSMWDSMASVYEAYKQKPNYNCLVVPIPYRTFDNNTNTWKDCYEIDLFPKEVNAVHYSEYSLVKNAPEVAFIHNPYDDYNYVTRVYEEYYSKNIKQNVNTLVYIPYYDTTGEFQQEHMQLSAYNNVDYIVVQSKSIKEQFITTPFYNKVLALGSPKLDAVISVCKKGGDIPNTWKHLLKGKKVVMLNTTISSVLMLGEIVLNKLQSVFEYIKNEKSIVVIWRPHPLLSSTIDSMRPNLREKYDTLLNYFESENIGILDTTPNITNTVAICDAYIGDDASSVLNLFGIANKPVFIFNYYLNAINERENTRFFCQQLTKIGNDYYTTSGIINGVFKVNSELKNAKLMTLSAENTFNALYNFHVSYNGKLYLSPLSSQYFYRYNIQKNKMEQLLNFKEPAKCMKILRYKHKIIYLPQQNNAIIIFDTVKNNFSFKEFPIPPVSQGSIIYYDDSYNFVQIDKEVYIVSNHSNIITCFNMEKETFTLYEVGPKTQSYIDICFDSEYFWLAGVYDSEVVRYNKHSGETVSYPMPPEFKSWQSVYGRTLPHSGLYCYKDYVYTMPALSNSMVKINKVTGAASIYMPELFKKQLTQEDMNNKIKYSQSMPIYKNESQLILQNNFDGEILNIDLEKDEVSLGYIQLDEKSYNEVKSNALGKSKGFFRRDFKETFCKRECILFSFNEFIKDLAVGGFEDIKQLQRESLSEIAENLDGTSGEKICNAICEIVEI